MHFAALRYLDQWLGTEQPIRTALLSSAREERRRAVDRGAVFFKVARNFPAQFDQRRGVPRYQPVLDAIRGLPDGQVAKVDALVQGFEASLRDCYGGKSMLSAASKILWLRYRDPVVIYDSRARVALGFRKACTYAQFRAAWERRWECRAAEIAEACSDLPAVIRYTSCGSRLSPPDVASVASARWFQRRVLDIALWSDGA